MHSIWESEPWWHDCTTVNRLSNWARVQSVGCENSAVPTTNSIGMGGIVRVCVLVPKQQTVSNLHQSKRRPRATGFISTLIVAQTRPEGSPCWLSGCSWKWNLTQTDEEKGGSKMVLGLKPSLKHVQGQFNVSEGLTWRDRVSSLQASISFCFVFSSFKCYDHRLLPVHAGLNELAEGWTHAGMWQIWLASWCVSVTWRQTLDVHRTGIKSVLCNRYK